MMDLFRQETESRCAGLSDNLLALKNNPADKDSWNLFIQAAHAVKGVAQIMSFTDIVNLSKSMESVFDAAKKGWIIPDTEAIDLLINALHILNNLASVESDKVQKWLDEQKPEITKLIDDITAVAEKKEKKWWQT